MTDRFRMGTRVRTTAPVYEMVYVEHAVYGGDWESQFRLSSGVEGVVVDARGQDPIDYLVQVPEGGEVWVQERTLERV